ncbi:lysine transporter LysE [Mesorhizobium sp. L-8-10]|uniref:LysE family translocator n=1 Tax=Mesorhizobium sp. L-8-10 TaxID=2744523 RepID=UPI001926BFEE|nr:LysE family translocator [Mesorhizobium sp. L-8-10]BCH32705.1 lysine transporter LysE [Mesorhizobium sp. L-8-10]
MTLAAFLAYCAAITLAAATPGPAMFAVISTGLSRGFMPAVLAGAGVALADAILVVLALLGLVALVQAFEWILLVLKYAGAAYLVWLGVKMWRAPAAAEGKPAGGSRARPFVLGASIGLSNPKAILFHASIMPLILDLDVLTITDGMVVIAVVIGANAVVMGIYAGLSTGAARLFGTERRMRMVNRISGGAMISAGALIASR